MDANNPQRVFPAGAALILLLTTSLGCQKVEPPGPPRIVTPTAPTVTTKPAELAVKPGAVVSQPSGVSSAPVTPNVAVAASTATSAPPVSTVIAKGEGNEPGIKVDVTELKRTGNGMVTLRMNFTNDGARDVSISVYEIGLLDLEEKRKYSPVRGTNSPIDCICSEHSTNVRAHESKRAWVRFPAPPATVKKVGIDIKGFGPIDDVTVTE